MIDHDPRAAPDYEPPSFGELVTLADQCGLIAGFEHTLKGVHFRAAGQLFTLLQRDAELLLHGILLGYFNADTSDDLTTAAWQT